MKKQDTLGFMLESGLIPIIRTTLSEKAIQVSEAMIKGEVKILEITMSVPKALQVLEKAADKFGDEVVVGAGTVLDPETARASIIAGAQFIVSPNVNFQVIEVCKRYTKIAIPGAMTPTEILQAWEKGADVVKVFPINVLGGAKYIKALKAPLPQIRLIPTGGVDLDNVTGMIKAGADMVGVGGSLVDKKAIVEGRFEIITQRAKQFVRKVREAKQQE